MSDPNDYRDGDSQEETGATDREQSNAWHDARAGFVRDYGNGDKSSLDPAKNADGYERAFPSDDKDEK